MRKLIIALSLLFLGTATVEARKHHRPAHHKMHKKHARHGGKHKHRA